MSGQAVPPADVEFIKTLAESNPTVFDNLQLRKRWSLTQKNANKALADQNLNIHFWNMLNHSPPKQVNNIVTPRVL